VGRCGAVEIFALFPDVLREGNLGKVYILLGICTLGDMIMRGNRTVSDFESMGSVFGIGTGTHKACSNASLKAI
jgi:hypothetical protein